MSWRRPVLAAACSLAIAAGGVFLTAAPAQAQEVVSGSLSFSGDPGDWISGGGSYSYSTANGDQLFVSSNNGSTVSISVNAYNGDWWYLDFDAPGSATLVPGTYDGATRYPFNGAGPGLDLSGNGRGCNTLTGSFTIINAVFGPNGYVQTFDATFEQHCEGGTAAARGEVHIANPAPPPPLALDLAVATDGTASTLNGEATLHGTVSCTQATTVSVSGTVVQMVKSTLIRGSFSTQVQCTPEAAVAWTASAVPDGTTPFQKGLVEADTQAQGYDSEYDRYVTVNTTTVVNLDKSKP